MGVGGTEVGVAVGGIGVAVGGMGVGVAVGPEVGVGVTQEPLAQIYPEEQLLVISQVGVVVVAVHEEMGIS